MLAWHLPPESAFKVALAGEMPWSLGDHLLATAVDLLAGANWQRGGGKGPKPKRVPRPGVMAGSDVERIGGVTTYSPDEMRALIDRHTRGG